MQCLLSFWPVILKQQSLDRFDENHDTFCFLLLFFVFLPEEAKACNRVMDLGGFACWFFKKEVPLSTINPVSRSESAFTVKEQLSPFSARFNLSGGTSSFRKLSIKSPTQL